MYQNNHLRPIPGLKYFIANFSFRRCHRRYFMKVTAVLTVFLMDQQYILKNVCNIHGMERRNTSILAHKYVGGLVNVSCHLMMTLLSQASRKVTLMANGGIAAHEVSSCPYSKAI